MYASALLTLVGVAGFTAAAPHERRQNVAAFPKGTPWDIVLDSHRVSVDDFKKISQKVIDIDLFDHHDFKTGKNNITELKKTKTVICYFSAGTTENWRQFDKSKFQPGDIGKPMEDWDGENWLDVKSKNVREIMKGRIQFAKDSGCDAIDPDNTDGYDHQDGFNYEKEVYADYIKFLAFEANNRSMAIGLKNSLSIIELVQPDVQFAVNEQCHEFNECGVYAPFTAANKAVFSIEYKNRNCTRVKDVVLSEVFKPLDLDKLGGQCS
ncbi:glycoside hydrolase superfamily [Dendryphion nanum]|uniref:alpha-galactosidase n=1 Tax=Dendryphion nanum TaxID=256645 RepID=A0A9P9IHC6_9PLEO|nr:glycoside hydrolase superfamily [Dendryphion nanum]